MPDGTDPDSVARRTASRVGERIRRVRIPRPRLGEVRIPELPFKEHFPSAPRTAQLMALFVLPFVIIASLAVIEVFHSVLEEFTLQNIDGAQLVIMQWVVTLITLVIFVGAIYWWIVFVRTGGHGLY